MPRQMADYARPRRGEHTSHRGSSASAPEYGRDQSAWHTGAGLPRLLALVILLTAAYSLIHRPQSSLPADREARPPSFPVVALPTLPASGGTSSAAPTASPVPSSSAVTPATALPIGIVAGHWGSDSGAVCDGWLQEVDINLDIARRVVYTLRAMGYSVDLLQEFDPRLEGYRARALVSIHADSCLYPEASGFKVARVEDSAVPGVEDRLVACLIRRYQARTGLAFHEGSITPDMTHYHTFYEIDPNTPGVIIEVGFMLADRDLLLHRQDLIAQGIVEGILCFVKEETP